MEIPKKINDEIWDYCRANKISNIDEFMLKLLTQGFSSEKYGATPATTKIIEKTIEVPVEKIVEKIVEVPITDGALNEKYAKLLEENENLKQKVLELEASKIKKRDIYGE